MAKKIPAGAKSKIAKAVAEVIRLPDGKYVTRKVMKLVDEAKSRRLRYLGKTPGKNSRTGREVIARMRKQGKIKGDPPRLVWKNPDTGKTEHFKLNQCDMGHHPEDAVSWWNRKGYMYGAKSAEARKWMLDPDNYELQPKGWNRSQGARLAEQYVDPGSAFL